MKRLSTKKKLALCLLILLAAAVMFFSVLGWKSPTAEVAFRRLEKRQLVGPAQILGTEQINCNYYNHMIIGASEYGYTAFAWYDSTNWDHGDLNYFPKQEDITLFLPLDLYVITGIKDAWLPVVVFAEDDSAVQARLTLQLDSEIITVEAARTFSGYFLFRLNGDVASYDFVIQLLRTLSPNYVTNDTATASITFFDRSGSELATYTPAILFPD